MGPYRVADPRVMASTTDPATWAAFADAVDAYSALVGRPDAMRGPVAGLGPVLTQAAGIACIDLDRVLDGGTLHPHAAQIVARCASFTEISPSGTGLHIFVRGAVAKDIKSPRLEVYSTARYIAVTGHHWPGTPPTLRDQQAYLDQLAAIAHPVAPRRTWTGPSAPPPDDLAGALLARLHAWSVDVAHVKRWSDGYLVELPRCPWASEHTTGEGGAAVMIHASGALDFTCLHAHCGGRTWHDFRAVMERAP